MNSTHVENQNNAVELTEKELLIKQLNILADIMTENYKLSSPKILEESDYKVSFEFGNKYIKIIKSFFGSSSCAGFIVCSHNAKFPYGTLLKSASFKAPALNFSRGNIFELDNKYVPWTGIL